MSQCIGIVRVGSHCVKEVYPPDGERWKITALVAKGLDFGIRLGSRIRGATGLILENECSLSLQIFIDQDSYLLFDNISNEEKIGFYCGEIIKVR